MHINLLHSKEYIDNERKWQKIPSRTQNDVDKCYIRKIAFIRMVSFGYFQSASTFILMHCSFCSWNGCSGSLGTWTEKRVENWIRVCAERNFQFTGKTEQFSIINFSEWIFDGWLLWCRTHKHSIFKVKLFNARMVDASHKLVVATAWNGFILALILGK